LSDAATQELPAATQQYPVVQPPPSRPPAPGWRNPGAWLAWARERQLLVLGLAGAAAIAALIATGTFSNFFGGSSSRTSIGTDLGPAAGIVVVGSSWVTGQPSLGDDSQFQALEARAVPLAEQRYNARLALIAAIAAAKKAAAAKARADLLRKYELERQRELAAYRAKLAEIQRERAAELAKQRAAQLKYQQALAAYIKKTTVTPGKECQDPTVSQYYSCRSGRLPGSQHLPGH
jgi:hypothetical protein